jgi:hypothetical protein
MTTMEILMSCVGLIICAVIFALIAVLVAGVVWWTFKTENVMQKDEYLNKNEDEYKA